MDKEIKVIKESYDSSMQREVNDLLESNKGWRVQAVSISPEQKTFIAVLVRSELDIEDDEKCPLCEKYPCDKDCDDSEDEGYF